MGFTKDTQSPLLYHCWRLWPLKLWTASQCTIHTCMLTIWVHTRQETHSLHVATGFSWSEKAGQCEPKQWASVLLYLAMQASSRLSRMLSAISVWWTFWATVFHILLNGTQEINWHMYIYSYMYSIHPSCAYVVTATIAIKFSMLIYAL